MRESALDFWLGCARGELRYQHCRACARPQYPARPFCARCGGVDLDVRRARGEGRIYARTTVTRAPSEEFAGLVPYAIVLVDMDEGYRMMAHAEPGLDLGERVTVGFVLHHGLHLPRFFRARAR